MVSLQQAMQNVDNTRYLLLRWKRKQFYLVNYGFNFCCLNVALAMHFCHQFNFPWDLAESVTAILNSSHMHVCHCRFMNI